MRLVLFCLLFTACGFEKACHSTVPPRGSNRTGDCYPLQISTKINPELDIIVTQFAADATQYNVPCHYTARIDFINKLPSNVPDNAIAYCTAPFEVMILRSFWHTALGMERTAVVYHELGHCALRMPHYDSDADIMNPYILSEDYLTKHWDELVDKFFVRARKEHG